MGEIFKLKLNNPEKTTLEIKKSSAHNFVINNLVLLDKLSNVELEIFELILKVEKGHLMFGAIDKKKIREKIEILKKEEARLMDNILENIDKTNNIDIIADNQQLSEAYESIKDEKIDNQEELENFDEDAENINDEEDYEYFNYDPDIFLKIKEKIKEKQENDKKKFKNNKTTIVENEDKIRLEKVIKLLSTRESDNSNQDVFDPQGELLKIKNSSREDKKEFLKKYRIDLGDQLFGMSKINNFLESEFSKNEKVNLASLYLQFKEKAKEYKLSQWQIERYNNVFNEFKEAKKHIKQEWKEYKNKPKDEVVREIIDADYFCKGEIVMENHEIALVFYIYNIDDYTRILSHKNSSEKIVEEDYDNARESGGFHQMGVVFINKSAMENPQSEKETLIHEIKHCINGLIDRGLQKHHEFEIAKGNENAKNIEEYFKNELRDSTNRAKDEILAYYKAGEDVENFCKKMFIENGPYDYFNIDKYIKRKNADEYDEDEENWRKTLKEYRKKEIKKWQRDYKLKYEEIVLESLRVLIHLEICGFSRSEIIGMLQSNPITEWKKIYRRIEKSSQFLQERKKNIDKQLPKYSEELIFLKKELHNIRKDKSLRPLEKSHEESALKEKIKIVKYKKEKLEEISSETT